MSLARFVDHLGEPRVLGCRPAPPGLYFAGPPIPAADLIAETDWSEVGDRYYAGMPVYDQDGKGACCPFSCVEAAEDARAMAGYEHVPLSPWYLYGLLAGGRDSGSNPGQALQRLLTKGVCRDALVPYAQFDPSTFSDQAHADAANFRVELGHVLTTRQALVTAILRREPCVITMCVGASYDDLDADGCVRVGPLWDNHALSTDGRLKRTRDGRWAAGFRNHWTAKWGDGGFAFVRLDDLFRNNSASSFTICAPKANATDNPPAPVDP